MMGLQRPCMHAAVISGKPYLQRTCQHNCRGARQLLPHSARQWQACRRRQRLSVAADGAIVPNMPFPGDDQASTIYTALSSVEAAAASVIERAEQRLEAGDSAGDRAVSERGASTATGEGGSASTNGARPDPNQKPPKVPHRWVIVGAMALAFVLCNMDKVRAPTPVEGVPFFVTSEILPPNRAWHACVHPTGCLCRATAVLHAPIVWPAVSASAAYGGVQSYGQPADHLRDFQVNMSVAVIPMAAELGWSASDRGLVSSAFFWGYSATQIPAGWVSTRCFALDHAPCAPAIAVPAHAWVCTALNVSLRLPQRPPLLCIVMWCGSLQDWGRQGAAGGGDPVVAGHSAGTSSRQDQPARTLRLPRLCAQPCL